MSEQFVNAAQTTLSAGITSGSTTMSVASAAGFPTSGNFRCLISAENLNGNEIVTVTAVSGLTFTISRATEAYAGIQSASSHSANAVVTQVLTAGALQSHTIQTFSVVLDGGGVALTTGVKADIVIDFLCTITQVELLADQSGSIVVDIGKANYSTWPTVTSICSSTKPTLSSAQKMQNTTLSGWTTTVNAGDILEFNINSVTTITRCVVAVKVIRG